MPVETCTPWVRHQRSVLPLGCSSASHTSYAYGICWPSIARKVVSISGHGSAGALVTTMATRSTGSGIAGLGRVILVEKPTK